MTLFVISTNTLGGKKYFADNGSSYSFWHPLKSGAKTFESEKDANERRNQLSKIVKTDMHIEAFNDGQ